ncbi:hypothetical protein ABW19_dt0205409 [Dactylella cylindrospora]|nr:hypothetical protein ABW19_dt0205409 [Dactylella cylindrospora]
MAATLTFTRQGGEVKDILYSEVVKELEQDQKTDPGYLALISEMLEATDVKTAREPRDKRWLFEYCMSRTEENRAKRAAKKSKEGVLNPPEEGPSKATIPVCNQVMSVSEYNTNRQTFMEPTHRRDPALQE